MHNRGNFCRSTPLREADLHSAGGMLLQLPVLHCFFCPPCSPSPQRSPGSPQHQVAKYAGYPTPCIQPLLCTSTIFEENCSALTGRYYRGVHNAHSLPAQTYLCSDFPAHSSAKPSNRGVWIQVHGHMELLAPCHATHSQGMAGKCTAVRQAALWELQELGTWTNLHLKEQQHQKYVDTWEGFVTCCPRVHSRSPTQPEDELHGCLLPPAQPVTHSSYAFGFNAYSKHSNQKEFAAVLWLTYWSLRGHLLLQQANDKPPLLLTRGEGQHRPMFANPTASLLRELATMRPSCQARKTSLFHKTFWWQSLFFLFFPSEMSFFILFQISAAPKSKGCPLLTTDPSSGWEALLRK